MKTKKILLSLILLSLCVALLIYGVYNNIESIYYVLFNGKTYYSSGYSEDAFHMISEGWDESKVIYVLGEPMTIQKLDFVNSWAYYATPSNKKSSELTYNLFGPITRISFDPNGIAIQVTGDFLKDVSIGMTQESIESNWGSPTSVIMQHAGYKYSYSKPGRSGTYKVRAVIFDENKVVIEKENYIYFD